MIPTVATLALKEPVTSDDVSRVQSNVKRSIDAMLRCPILDGVLVSKVKMLKSGAPNIVNHGLGRPVRGWFPVRIRTVSAQAVGFSDVQDGAPALATLPNPHPDQTLWLGCSDDCTADFWVF